MSFYCQRETGSLTLPPPLWLSVNTRTQLSSSAVVMWSDRDVGHRMIVDILFPEPGMYSSQSTVHFHPTVRLSGH